MSLVKDEEKKRKELAESAIQRGDYDEAMELMSEMKKGSELDTVFSLFTKVCSEQRGCWIENSILVTKQAPKIYHFVPKLGADDDWICDMYESLGYFRTYAKDSHLFIDEEEKRGSFFKVVVGPGEYQQVRSFASAHGGKLVLYSSEPADYSGQVFSSQGARGKIWSFPGPVGKKSLVRTVIALQ